MRQSKRPRSPLSLITSILSLGLWLSMPEPGQAAPKEGGRATQVGVNMGMANVNSKGFFVGTLRESPVYGIEGSLALRRQAAGVIHVETNGSTYFNSGLSLRYFPWSLAGSRSVRSDFAEATFDDATKVFLTIGPSFGRLRLETQDKIGATEIAASYFGFDFGVGSFFTIYPPVAISLEATLGMMNATSDSAVAFSGQRLGLLLGVAVEL